MNLLLGVTGGIAAYKAASLTSDLVKRGYSVRVVMTESATRFVGPPTFEALCNHPVMVDALATGHTPDGASAVEHVSWAKWADIAVVAPCTASTLARLALGMASDALSTVWLAIPEGFPSRVSRDEHGDVGPPGLHSAIWRGLQSSVDTRLSSPWPSGWPAAMSGSADSRRFPTFSVRSMLLGRACSPTRRVPCDTSVCVPGVVPGAPERGRTTGGPARALAQPGFRQAPHGHG